VKITEHTAVNPDAGRCGAAPVKIAWLLDNPKSPPTPAPATNGTATPTVATIREARPDRPELRQVHLPGPTVSKLAG